MNIMPQAITTLNAGLSSMAWQAGMGTASVVWGGLEAILPGEGSGRTMPPGMIDYGVPIVDSPSAGDDYVTLPGIDRKLMFDPTERRAYGDPAIWRKGRIGDPKMPGRPESLSASSIIIGRGPGLHILEEMDRQVERGRKRLFGDGRPPRLDFDILRKAGSEIDLAMWRSRDEKDTARVVELSHQKHVFRGHGLGHFSGEMRTGAFALPQKTDSELLFVYHTFAYLNCDNPVFEGVYGGRTWLAALDMESGEVGVTAAGEGVREEKTLIAVDKDLARFVGCLKMLTEAPASILRELRKLIAATDIKGMNTLDIFLDTIGCDIYSEAAR